MKLIKIVGTGILIAGRMQAMESIEHSSRQERELVQKLKSYEQQVEKMMSVPDEKQKQSLYMFMNCLKRINLKTPGIYCADIRHLLARQLRIVIGGENMHNSSSAAYQWAYETVLTIEDGVVKRHLLEKYFGQRRMRMHDKLDIIPNLNYGDDCCACCVDVYDNCLDCCCGGIWRCLMYCEGTHSCCP